MSVSSKTDFYFDCWAMIRERLTININFKADYSKLGHI